MEEKINQILKNQITMMEIVSNKLVLPFEVLNRIDETRNLIKPY